MIFRHLLNMRSHPTWVRGLKLNKQTSKRGRRHVAPYVGAWIETQRPQQTSLKRESHPTWVRGLKHCNLNFCVWVFFVAPYVGAWIETNRLDRTVRTERVAPYVGAWIETQYLPQRRDMFKSHPTWVRGLKH